MPCLSLMVSSALGLSRELWPEVNGGQHLFHMCHAAWDMASSLLAVEGPDIRVLSCPPGRPKREDYIQDHSVYALFVYL